MDPSRRGEERRRGRWPTVLLSAATDGGLPLVLARFVRGLSTHQGSGCLRRLRNRRFGAGEGSLRVDHPFGLAGRPEVLGEAPPVAEGLQPAGEAQLFGLEGVLQRREKNSPEVAREHPDRQEESGSAGNPAAAVAGEPPTRGSRSADGDDGRASGPRCGERRKKPSSAPRWRGRPLWCGASRRRFGRVDRRRRPCSARRSRRSPGAR